MNLIRNLLCIAFALLLSSCVFADANGRKRVTLPGATSSVLLPRDPLREATIDRLIVSNYEKRLAARAATSKPPQATARPVSPRTIVADELQPPPVGFMFSSRTVSGGAYQIRGVTGTVERLSVSQYEEFSAECRTRGWLIYRY